MCIFLQFRAEESERENGRENLLIVLEILIMQTMEKIITLPAFRQKKMRDFLNFESKLSEFCQWKQMLLFDYYI